MESPTLDRAVLDRLPLAEAVLLAMRHATLPQPCQDLFERHQGPCYTHQLTFDVFVQVVSDALVRCRGSGRQACAAAREQGRLTTSHQAFYEKLSRVPLAVSEAFLADNTARMLPLLPPQQVTDLPASLADFPLRIIDGKVVKRVAKKLKVLWRLPGGALGGKGLVCLDGGTGLLLALASTPDGHTNDCALVPALLAQARPTSGPKALWLADSQFCDLNQFEEFCQDGHHALVRYHPKVHFCPDSTRPAQTGFDRQGRRYVEAWGWLGREGNPRRRYVRQITLERPGEKAVVLVTDLLDAAAIPAGDLLAVYLRRWGIEQVFQKITEVFNLARLISSHPKGTIFQLAFCLLLYNLIQLVRSYVAAGQGLVPEAVSTEMLFADVREELVALAKLVEADAVVDLVVAPPSVAGVRARLEELLGRRWRPIWRKTTNRQRRPHQAKARARGHQAVQRVLDQERQRSKPALVGDTA